MTGTGWGGQESFPRWLSLPLPFHINGHGHTHTHTHRHRHRHRHSHSRAHTNTHEHTRSKRFPTQSAPRTKWNTGTKTSNVNQNQVSNHSSANGRRNFFQINTTLDANQIDYKLGFHCPLEQQNQKLKLSLFPSPFCRQVFRFLLYTLVSF